MIVRLQGALKLLIVLVIHFKVFVSVKALLQFFYHVRIFGQLQLGFLQQSFCLGVGQLAFWRVGQTKRVVHLRELNLVLCLAEYFVKGLHVSYRPHQVDAEFILLAF